MMMMMMHGVVLLVLTCKVWFSMTSWILQEIDVEITARYCYGGEGQSEAGLHSR